MKTSWLIAIVVVVLAVGAYLIYGTSPATPNGVTATSTTTGTQTGQQPTLGAPPATGLVTYYCMEGQVKATYSATQVALKLSDGRSMTLPQIPVTTGVAYAATTTGKWELFESKSANATLSENNKAIYSNCVAAHVTDAGGGFDTYLDQTGSFTFKYPYAFSVNATEPGPTKLWMTNATALGNILASVVLPGSTQPKTNFSGGTFTVGASSDAQAVASCLSYNPTGGSATVPSTTVSINGLTYTKFKSSDAGAGNLYDITSYRIVHNNQCYAIEYVIHSTQLGNYPPSAGVKAFNATTVNAQLAAIAASFKFLK